MSARCHNCRKWGAPAWHVYADGHRKMVAPCCQPSRAWSGWTAFREDGPAPDVAQWLRTRAIRVAWLINARRHLPGLTVDRQEDS